jgi:hypothetical protein
MGLDAVWQEGTYAGYEVWVWLRHEVAMHPFLFLAAAVVIISAFIMYKAEVKSK